MRGRSGIPKGTQAIPKGTQGRPDARRTRGLACKSRENSAHEHTGSAEAVRPSLRNGFNGYFALFPVTGFLATVASEKMTSQKLDASTGASEPHDFAVRLSAVRQERLRVHRIPPHVRDDRETPLGWDGMAVNKPVIWVGCEADYFSRDDWTLIPFGKFCCPSNSLVARMSRAFCFTPGHASESATR